MRTPIEATDPYKIQRSLFLNLINPASLLEQKLGGALLAPTRGLYRMGEVEPVFKSGVPYFTMHRDASRGHALVFTQIMDINTVESAVYDEAGKNLVSAAFMKQKAYTLSPGPTVPARALHLIEDVVDYAIHSVLAWTSNQQSTNKILSHFRPEFRHLVDVEDLLQELRYVITEVMSFVGDDTYCYYTLKLSNSDLFVNKCQDYRVIQWEATQLASVNGE